MVFHMNQYSDLLFVIYIYDLDENVEGLVDSFASDTKIGGVAFSE